MTESPIETDFYISFIKLILIKSVAAGKRNARIARSRIEILRRLSLQCSLQLVQHIRLIRKHFLNFFYLLILRLSACNSLGQFIF